MTSWRKSEAVAGIAVVLFLVIQLTIPILHFGGSDGVQRFAWQMFSFASPAPSFELETATGREQVDLHEFMARARADIAIEELLPPHLCTVVPSAIRITWESGEYEC